MNSASGGGGGGGGESGGSGESGGGGASGGGVSGGGLQNSCTRCNRPARTVGILAAFRKAMVGLMTVAARKADARRTNVERAVAPAVPWSGTPRATRDTAVRSTVPMGSVCSRDRQRPPGTGRVPVRGHSQQTGQRCERSWNRGLQAKGSTAHLHGILEHIERPAGRVDALEKFMCAPHSTASVGWYGTTLRCAHDGR